MIELYKEILRKEIKPNRYTYGYMMEGFSKTGPVENVLTAFKAYSGNFKIETNFLKILLDFAKPDGYHYALLIKTFALFDDNENMFKYFEEMKNKGIKPTAQTFNSIVESKY